jgi:ribosomal protein S7
MRSESKVPFSWRETHPRLRRLSRILRKCGKQTVAEGLIEECARHLRKRGVTNVYDNREYAIVKLSPRVELRSTKKAGQAVQIPVALSPKRAEGRARRILKSACADGVKRRGEPYAKRLAAERYGILSNKDTSVALARRNTQHRRAVAARGNVREA